MRAPALPRHLRAVAAVAGFAVVAVSLSSCSLPAPFTGYEPLGAEPDTAPMCAEQNRY